MARSRERAGKRKATSPDGEAPPEVDAAALRQHNRALVERRSKAREDVRSVPPSRSRPQVKRHSPPPKRKRVIQVSTSGEEEADEGEHSDGSLSRSQSWRYVFFSHFQLLILLLLRHFGFSGFSRSLHLRRRGG